MLKNKYEISKLLGMVLLGPCIFLLSVLFNEIYREIQYGDDFTNWDSEMTYILIPTIISFAASIGFILKIKWTRYLLSVLIVGLMGLWYFFLISEALDGGDVFISIGMTLFVTISGVSILMLIFNKVIRDEFGIDEVEDDYEGELLDDI